MMKSVINAGVLVLLCFVTTAIASDTVQVTTDVTTVSGYTHMLAPNGHGWILPMWGYEQRYPSGKQNMQFMAFYNQNTDEILYVQTKDSEGRVVDWAVSHVEGSDWQLKLTFYTLDGNNPEIVKETSMTAENFTQFYKKVAQRYKSWAINQFWAKREKSVLDDAHTISIAHDLHPGDGYKLKTRVIPYIEQWEGKKTICWSTFWRRWPGFSQNWPDYVWPDSSYSRSEGMALLKEHNALPVLYVNGCLWDADNTAAVLINPSNPLAVYDANDMATDENGDIYIYKDEDEGNIHFVCQTRDRWQTVIKDAWDGLKSAGASGIYYDMAAEQSPYLCYNSSHSHVPGDPLVFQQGVRSILQYIKDDGGIILVEGTAEIYIDLVDGFLSYINTDWEDTQDNMVVPLLKEVYGEAVRMTGWKALGYGKSISDLTPDILESTILKAANFGSLNFASPYFISWSASMETQDLLVQNSNYASVLDMTTQNIYKKVYETGMGADSWKKTGSIADAINVVDDETGTAAVLLEGKDRDSGSYYELELNETERFHISWDMKFNSPYYIDVIVEAFNNDTRKSGWYYLVYENADRKSQNTRGVYGSYGLGVDTTDSNWRTIRRDLEADVAKAYSNLTIEKVVKILVFGNGLIDNVSLSNSSHLYEDGSGSAEWVLSNIGNGSAQSAKSAIDSDTNEEAVNFSGISDRDGLDFYEKQLADYERFEIAWDMKSSKSYYFLVCVAADDGYWYNLVYENNDRDFRGTFNTNVRVGLGADTSDGNWRTFRRNLADDLFEATGTNIVKVNYVRFYGSGSIDNLVMYGNGVRTSGR
ncbi:MAG: hypothetical protein GY874_17035 [Desulfobacteraceae bacterium]|nr:hypothetical protein [Desulfobacteraceae bacterium]